MILTIQNTKPFALGSIVSDADLKYKQIAKAIITDIERGEFKVGDKLLSITKFSLLHTVSRDTVERAYNELRSQGYIKAVKSKGFFVVGKKRAAAKILVLSNKNKRSRKGVYAGLLESLHTHFNLEIGASAYDFETLNKVIENKAKEGYSCVVILQ